MILIIFVEAIVLTGLCHLLSKQRYKYFSYLVFIVLILETLIYFNSHWIPIRFISLFLQSVVLQIYCFINFEGKIEKKIFYGAIGVTYLCVTDIIVLLCMYILNISYISVVSNEWLIIMGLSRFTLLGIYYYLKLVSTGYKSVELTYWAVILLILVMTVTCEITLIYSIWVSQLDVWNLVMNSIVLLLIIIFVVLIYKNDLKTINHRIQSLYAKERVDAYLENKSKIVQINEELQIIKHDLKNHIYIFKELSKSKASEAYADTLTETLETNIFPQIPNDTLFFVLKSKSILCKEKEIKLVILIFNDFSFMDEVDLVILFGNLLDNAIEAQENLNGFKKITIETKMEGDTNIVVIRNTIDRPILSTNRNLKTTKKDKHLHGLGLKSVRKVVAKYNGKILFDESDIIFEVTCILKSKYI